jgi:drug/metabolite transporter (DMT)-like permease
VNLPTGATNARRIRTGIAYVAASAVAFGAMAILARFAFASGVDTSTLLALRFGIASIVMLVLMRARGIAFPRGSTLGVLIALGALGYGGQAVSYFTAIRLAPAGLAALLLYLHPALVAVLAAVFLRERLTTPKLVALAIALLGTTLTVVPAIAADALAAAPQVLTGLAFAVASAVFYAVYIIVAAAIGRRAEALPMSTVVIASAAGVFVVAVLTRGPQWPQTSVGWLAVAGIALLSTVAAITLYFAGLERIGPVRASTLSTIEPLCTVILAAIVLDESLAPVQVAGGVLILAAAVLIARAKAA